MLTEEQKSRGALPADDHQVLVALVLGEQPVTASSAQIARLTRDGFLDGTPDQLVATQRAVRLLLGVDAWDTTLTLGDEAFCSTPAAWTEAGEPADDFPRLAA